MKKITKSVFGLLTCMSFFACTTSLSLAASNKEFIVTAAGKGGGPHVRVFSETGSAQFEPESLFAFDKGLRTGLNVTTGDIDADGQDEIIVAPKKGAGPHIQVFEKSGERRPIQFFAFHPQSRTGVSVDSADFDDDGKDEIVAAQEQDGHAWIKIYRYNTEETVVAEWNAFGNAKVGARVVAGDIDADRRAEIIAGAGKGGGPQVRIFDGSGTVKRQFFAFEESYRGGIDVALGDTNADTVLDTIAVSKLSGDSTVRLFSTSGNLLKEFKAFDAIPIGAHVDMADTNGDFIDDVIVSAAAGGGPQVRVFDSNGSLRSGNFFAYDSAFRGGVDIAGGYFNANESLVGAGDIAGCAYGEDEDTARLLDTIPGTVFTAGDNVYNTGTESEFTNCYGPTWGRHKGRTKPSPGNHDYYTTDATGYYDYFGAVAGDRDKGFYSYDIGNWHILSLNSNCTDIGGCGEGSAQDVWLNNDLATHKNYCTLAYFHHPRYSSFQHGNTIEVLDMWKRMYAYGVDVVVNGHDHAYERFGLQDPYSLENTQDGIQQFLVGTGGKSLYSVGDIKANSEKRINTDHGVIQFDLMQDKYSWDFISTSGAVLDSGMMSCR